MSGSEINGTISPTETGSDSTGRSAEINSGSSADGGVGKLSFAKQAEEESKDPTAKTAFEEAKARVNAMTDEKKSEMLEEWVSSSLGGDFSALNYFKLKTDTPKAADMLVEYIKTKAATRQEVDEEIVVGTLLYSPRTIVPSFLDSNKQYVNLSILGEGRWLYVVNDIQSPAAYSNRSSAEAAGWEAAMANIEAIQV